jgi:hypothetical protein
VSPDLKIKLSGGLPMTASWVGINEAGHLAVEMLQYGSRAKHACDTDVAFVVTVAPEHWPVLWQRLHGKGDPPKQVKPKPLLDAIHARFDSYYAVEGWLEQQGIPFQTRLDSQA